MFFDRSFINVGECFFISINVHCILTKREIYALVKKTHYNRDNKVK